MKDKIIEHFVNADYDTMTNGLNWYIKAYNEAVLLSQVFDTKLEIVIGVIAALSPRNKWARNLADTWDLLDEPSMSTKCSTFNGQKQKALDIINGAPIEETLKGRKTVNFFNNIMYHNSSMAVTVDVWAFRSVELEPKEKYYNEVETAYQDVAEELGLMPWQVQAVVWGVVRGKTA